MELAEKIQIHIDSPDSEDCPFCPAKETKHEWKTFKGADNDGGVLRKAMNKPSRCGHAQQSGAKPKDGKYPNQNKDSEKPNPNPIYSHSEHGDYGNEAHHCISGNEIMKGEAIEKIIANEEGKYKGKTGYTINNNANGVFLPSYPVKYSGQWAPKSTKEKYEIMKLAMAAGKGQAHIGSHTGHNISGGKDYPTTIKEELTALKKRVIEKSEECPFCVEGDGKPKKPFVPPYKVNQWLDGLSKRIETKLKGSARSWPYFISKYAKKYYMDAMKPKPPKSSRYQ